LVADLRRDYVRTLFMPSHSLDFPRMEANFREMEEEGEADVQRASGSVGALVRQRGLDMRYVGQEHAVTVDVPLAAFENRDLAAIKAAFDAVHTLRYGYCSATEPAEIVSLRTSVTGHMPKPAATTPSAAAGRPPVQPATRPVYFSAAFGWRDTPVYARDSLAAGTCIDGPALVEEYASTTVMLPGDRMTVDTHGNLVIEVGNDIE
jgi:N-methylhydantoinase A